MSGTKLGGLKAAKKNLKNDPDFYRRIGAMGGKAISSMPKGFAANPDFARATASQCAALLSRSLFLFVPPSE